MNSFEHFITDAVVSLFGSTEHVQIQVLRDTGAQHSFILGSVLPFSSLSDTWDFILMRGMGLERVPVLLHNIMLDCNLVHREVLVGVRPALPVDGVVMILGNNLAGDVVWADGPPSPVVTSKSLASGRLDESGQSYSGVLPACAVMCAQSRILATFVPPVSVEVKENPE